MRILLSTALVAALAGCGESDTRIGTGGAAGVGGATSSASSTGGMGQGGATLGTTSSATGPGSGYLVINEVSALDDWVELFNRGDAPVDLEGLMLADRDTPGGPKTAEAITFPAGTVLDPGAYLFVLAKQPVSPGEQAPQSACDPGASPCFHAPFGFSDADGDAAFLLDGDTVLDTIEYPAGAATGTETWCRLPNGSVDLDVCSPTPSAENAPP